MQQRDSGLVLPRGLILVSSVWLVISWTIAIGFRTPVEASSASYTPGVRVMLISVAVGLMIGWPLLRLSQRSMPLPTTQTVLDLVVLIALLQVVLWPLRLVTPWSPARTAAIDATLFGWTALIAALVASAVRSERAGPRNMVMLVCVATCVGGPALAWLASTIGLGGLAERLLRVGPLLEVHDLSSGGGTPPNPGHWTWIATVALAAAAAWGGLTLSRPGALRAHKSPGHVA